MPDPHWPASSYTSPHPAHAPHPDDAGRPQSGGAMSALGRIAAWLGLARPLPPSPPPRFLADVQTRTQHSIEIADASTGEVRVYDRIEDVPPRFRAALDAMAPLAGGHVEDSRAVYTSRDELPPDVRERIEAMLAQPPRTGRGGPHVATSRIEQLGPAIRMQIREGASGREYVYCEDGEEYVFDSVDDLPEDVRRAFQAAEQVMPPPPEVKPPADDDAGAAPW
jgi:hypothetical protein